MIKGVDVSDAQGNIDFNKLEVDFILIKATEGTGFIAKKFLQDQAGARGIKLLIGYYHYARPDLGNKAEDEADYFLNNIGKIEEGELLCLDFEVACSDKVNWCKTWLDRVYEKTKCKPIIYLNKSLEKGNNWQPVVDAGYGLWLADYSYAYDSPIPATKYWKIVALRQYDNEGVVKGITGVVDLDVFYGDKEAFKEYGFHAGSDCEQKLAELDKELDDMRDSRNKWRDECGKKDQTIEQLNQQIGGLKTANSTLFNENQDLKGQVASLEKGIKDLPLLVILKIKYWG